MISVMQLSELLRSTEQDILDFKREFHNIRNLQEVAELIRDIIALANSAYARNYPESYMIFGIEDKTRDCVGIESQQLIEKDKERIDNQTHLQIALDEFNQRKFVSLVKKYIDGYLGNIRVNYSTYPHPNFETNLVGILVITSSYAPYTVKREIPKIGQNGKTIGSDIERGQAWIRDGEDKRPMVPVEILEMQDNAENRKRQKRRDEKLKMKLGELLTNKWNIRLLNFDDNNIEPTGDALPKTPLRTPDQLGKYFYPYQSLNKQLSFLGNQDWHLNHIIISGQINNGRTTLLNYLANLRREQGESVSIPILLEKIPDSPQLSDFLECLQALGTKLEENSKKLLILDILDHNFHATIEFIHLVIGRFKNVYIWVVCDEINSQELFNLINSNSKQKVPLLITLDFLDKDEKSFDDLRNKYFVDNNISIELEKRQNLTYEKLVEIYNFWKSGNLSILKVESPDFMDAQFNTLGTYERLLLKICYLVSGLDEIIFNVLVLAFELKLDTVEKLADRELIIPYFDTQKRKLKLSTKINVKKLTVDDLEIRLLIDALNKIDIGITGIINSWYLANLISQIKSCTNSEKLLVGLNRIKYKLKGAHYCQICDEYYLSSTKGCPSCGFKHNFSVSELKVSKSEYFLPFPNKNELSKGTFNPNRGVDPQQIQLIAKALPPYRHDV